MIRAIATEARPSPSVSARRPRAKRSFSKYDVLRAMDAVRSGGLEVASVEIGPDGTIRLAAAQAAGTTFPVSEFEKWQDRL